MARKKKAKGEQDVEAWLIEYDKEMGSKHKAFRDEMAVYEGVVAQLKEFLQKTNQLKKERERYEKEERERRIREITEHNQQKRLDAAAASIQSTWKEHWVTHTPRHPCSLGLSLSAWSRHRHCLLSPTPSIGQTGGSGLSSRACARFSARPRLTTGLCRRRGSRRRLRRQRRRPKRQQRRSDLPPPTKSAARKHSFCHTSIA